MLLGAVERPSNGWSMVYLGVLSLAFPSLCGGDFSSSHLNGKGLTVHSSNDKWSGSSVHVYYIFIIVAFAVANSFGQAKLRGCGFVSVLSCSSCLDEGLWAWECGPVSFGVERRRVGSCRTIRGMMRLTFESVRSDSRDRPFLMSRLHRASTFVPRLSLISRISRRVVNRVLVAGIRVISRGGSIASLKLTPISILPRCRGQKVKSTLVHRTRGQTARLKCNSIILLKRGSCCPEFNCGRTVSFNVRFPFSIPRRCYVTVRLHPGDLGSMRNVVRCTGPFARWPEARGERGAVHFRVT